LIIHQISLDEPVKRGNMAATTQDVIMLVGDSITEGGWAQGGFAQLLAGAQITSTWVELDSKTAMYREIRPEARCPQPRFWGLSNGLGNSSL